VEYRVSGFVTFKERSIPIFMVPDEEAQVPQAPCQTTSAVNFETVHSQKLTATSSND